MEFLQGDREVRLTALLLNMHCWKLELSETVNSNANYSFSELVRQNMRSKLQQ